MLRPLLALALLGLSLAATGCGQRDPVQVELREYQRVVVGPINADEEQFGRELAAAEEARPKGDLETAALLPVFRDKLLPIYQGILARARTHRPRAPQVLALHNELIGYYQVGVADLTACVEAMAANDAKALGQAQQAMLSRDADGLAGRLERLYAKHKLAIE